MIQYDADIKAQFRLRLGMQPPARAVELLGKELEARLKIKECLANLEDAVFVKALTEVASEKKRTKEKSRAASNPPPPTSTPTAERPVPVAAATPAPAARAAEPGLGLDTPVAAAAAAPVAGVAKGGEKK